MKTRFRLALPPGTGGFSFFTAGLLLMGWFLPKIPLGSDSKPFLITIGTIALWRYGWGLVHFIRSYTYRHFVFPSLRRAVTAQEEAFLPPHIYLLITSFRIESATTIKVYKAAIREAIQCGIPATIVASLVELGDEFLVKELFRQANPPAHVNLMIVRIPGTGKRDGLAQGFRAISRALPPPDSVVAVIDGDSILDDNLIRRCAPFFRMMPGLGALTTDEVCEVEGRRVIREWHHLRFAQRQVLMSSVALSRKVLTLTGRMSMFRADIVTNPDFIRQVEHDSVDHWRLGRFRFLTGDDKSSWFWLLKNGYDMLYVPDTLVKTVEHPPSGNFFKASTMLMFRWFGNMLRTNGRAIALGPQTTGFFTWWCLLDQRVSMWTSLTGPAFALMLTFKHSLYVLPVYLLWIGWTRWVMALMLLASRPVLSWYYPFLIYYNQIWGSCIKTYVFFRLDRQSWTRQKTKLNRGLSGRQQTWQALSSTLFHTLAVLIFLSLIGTVSGVLTIPAF